MAIWDAIGQTLGASVSELLGGFTDRIRVSHMVGFAPADEMVAEAERIRAHLRHHDLQGEGRPPPLPCRTSTRAAPCATPSPDVELYIDGNRGWTASESARALREMADLDLTFAEELCPADDVLGRRWLVEHSPIPMYADESVARPRRGDPRAARRRRHRHQHQDLPHRLHHQPADPRPVRGHSASRSYIGNQIDTQIGSLCAAAFGARPPPHRPSRRRAVQLPRHERRPARRATASSRTASSGPPGPRARHLDRRGQARPLPHRLLTGIAPSHHRTDGEPP